VRLFALLLFAITCIGLVGVGIRLLRAGARTRTQPEIIYGLAYLLGGASAFVRALVAILGMQPQHHWLQMLGGVLGSIATLCLLVGIQRIFRPEQTWGLGISIVAALALVGSLAARLGIPVSETETSLAQLVQEGIAVGAYLWGAGESIRYYGLMRRRLAIGLTKPMIVQQFRLWGLSFLTISAAVSINIAVKLIWHVGVAEFPLVLCGVQMLVATSAMGTWLCFFPPTAYRRWIETGEGAVAS
jgi:hypothetical protein